MVSIALLAACAALTGCGQQGGDPAEVAAAELRTYDVPPEHQDELREMLQSAMGTGDDRMGRVTNGPGGSLIVVAPARIQAGIQEILDGGFEEPPVASPIRLTYWFLVGRPQASSGATGTFSLARGQSVPQLEPALTQIASTQGPTEFSLLDTIQITSIDQRTARSNGRFAEVVQSSTRSGEQIVADINITIGNMPGVPSNGFGSRVMLEPGQFLVLGQAGFGGAAFAFPDAGPDDVLTLYYVMAADVVS